MNIDTIDSQEYYIKKSGRPWYWAMLSYSILGFIFAFFSGPLINLFIHINVNLYLVVNIAESLLSVAITAVILLAFARNSTIRVFSVLLIVLACVLLIGFASSILSTLASYSILKHAEHPGNSNAAISIIRIILILIYSAIHLACYVVFTLHRKSGTLLRVSSILLALFAIYSTIFTFFGPTLIQSIIEGSALDLSGYAIFMKYVIAMQYIGHINGFIGLLLGTFFYTALTFSKMKPPKAIIPPAEVESAPQMEDIPYE